MLHRIHILPVLGFIFSVLLAAQSAAAQSVRIMHVGDADVSGCCGYVSSRYDLWFMLIEAGYDVDFVGRKFLPISAVNTELYPRYDEFDDDHEGSTNQSLSQMASIASMIVEVNDPQVVLLMTSYWDICESGHSAPGLARTRFAETIDNMRAVNPDLHFLLGQAYAWHYPNCEPDAPEIIPVFNQQIAEVAAAKDRAGSRVVLVDHYTGFNPDTMYDDSGANLANRQGEMFIAGNWFDALEDIIPLVEPEGDSIAINAGLNDAWYNPATPGQGFFVTVFPDIEMMFLAWFTYDTERPADNAQANLGEAGHRWLTALGPYEGNVADLKIELTSGGVFNAANPATTSVDDGMIMVEFDGCNAATVMYDILSAGVAGEIPIERIALDNVPACEALAR